MNNIIELSNKNSKGGRRKIKMALLTIHENADETNLNGIHWDEQFVKNNMDSANGMSICAEFLDDTKTVPYGHGSTGIVEIDGKKEPLFEDSEEVGHIQTTKIETININGVDKKVLVGYGYLNIQRYPNFVNWITDNLKKSNVDSSIEIMGKEENENKIIYLEDEPTDEFRTPKIFDFSGTCILSVQPSDKNAIVIEVNSNKEDKINMTDEELKNVITSTINEINAKNEDTDKVISELNETIKEKDGKISELNATVAQVQKALDDLKKEQETYWEEREALKKELGELKAKERLAKFNDSLGQFSEEEQKYAESEINEFKADPMKGDIDSIVSKICTNIVINQKKEEERISEENSKRNKDTESIDIFSEVNSDDDDKTDNEDEINIF